MSRKTPPKLTKAELTELIELRRRDELPHLYGYPWYDWAYKFYTSTNRYNFLCAANQISKSSTQIRKAIHWATAINEWPKLWRSKPTQFWYLYPTKPVATGEFNEKWEPEFLPRGTMKKDPIYGWEVEYKNREWHAIHFNSGVSIYSKTYEQDTQHLQTGTCYAIFCDEELPFDHFQELRSRLTATNGYFHMVFTATLGQDQWRRTMEPADDSEELFTSALKLTVSMWDCLKYRDGSLSQWTPARIKEVELECATEAEVQKRVYGRFVVSSGLMYPGFNRVHNLAPNKQIPSDWHIYSGVDIGTGGEKNHPAAICFVAVRPDYKFGIVFRGWRGDGIQTTAADILEKHNQLLTYEVHDDKGSLTKRQIHPVIQSYDWQARDFFMIATRAGVGFTPAQKKRDAGESLINTLFKLRMLAIMDGDPELAKLVVEITSLKSDTAKQRAVDDFVDSLRYCVMPIPWNFEGVAGELIKAEESYVDTRSEGQRAFDERKPGRIPDQETAGETIEDEFSEWQSYLDV